VQIAVLGPVQAVRDGADLDLGPQKQRALIAGLVLHAGHVVPVETLTDLLWGDAPPAALQASLHGYVAALRRVLEPGRAARSGGSVLVTRGSGYLLDAMDILLYVFALNTLKHEFGLTNRMAGLVSSATLISSAAGGILCGVLADRLGRTRTLVYTILLYSLGSGGTATAHSFGQLVFWRALVGFGLGGEWSAGAVLVSETWPPERRGRAIAWMQSGWALGYILAAGVTAVVLPRPARARRRPVPGG